MASEEASDVDPGGIQKQQNHERDFSQNVQVIFGDRLRNEVAPRQKRPEPQREHGGRDDGSGEPLTQETERHQEHGDEKEG